MAIIISPNEIFGDIMVLGFQVEEISYMVVQLKSHNWSCNWSCHLSYVINICGVNIGGHTFHLLQSLVIARLYVPPIVAIAN